MTPRLIELLVRRQYRVWRTLEGAEAKLGGSTYALGDHDEAAVERMLAEVNEIAGDGDALGHELEQLRSEAR